MPQIEVCKNAFVAYHKLSALNPTFNKRGSYVIGSADHELMLDFLALDAVASSHATGRRPRKSEQTRVDIVISKLGL